MAENNPTVELQGGEYDANGVVEAVRKALDEDGNTKNGVVGRCDGVYVVGDGYGTDDDGVIVDVERENNVHMSLQKARGKAEEALPSDEPDAGFYVRAESVHDGGYGFEIPLSDADQFVIEYDSAGGNNNHRAAWNTDVDVSELYGGDKAGGARSLAEEHGFDAHAVVSTVEIVERKE